MRIIFAGSPAIAVPALEALTGLALESGAPDSPAALYAGSSAGSSAGPSAAAAPAAGFELAGILTNPDSPRGRRGKPEPTDVARAAAALAPRFEAAGRGPPVVLKPEKLGSGARGQIEALGPDILVSFAYGKIFGPKFLALFPLGGINIHPSLLPAYRGPTPIPQAILNRDRETGISIQRLAPEMDSGDILVQEAFPLTGAETAASLGGEMARRGALLIVQALRGVAAGTLEARPQDHAKASYCRLLSREDGRIDWGGGALDIEARIRAYNPWPLSWTMDGEQRLYILKASVGGAPPEPGEKKEGTAAAPGTVLGIDRERGILVQTGEGTLAVSMLQYGAKKALDWKAFLNGARGFAGRRLG